MSKSCIAQGRIIKGDALNFESRIANCEFDKCRRWALGINQKER